MRFPRPLIAAALLVAATIMPQLALADGAGFDRGLLWRIEKPGVPASHVFGTMHVSDERVTTLAEPVTAAFEASRAVALELVIEESLQDKIGDVMLLPAGESLATLLTKRQLLLLRDVAAHYGLPPERFLGLKPWAVWFLFGSSPGERQKPGEKREPLDMMLQHRAQDAGKKVVALETPEEQLAVFDGLPQADQLALLAATLETGADAGRYAALMRNLYLSRNIGGLLHFFTIAADTQSLAAMEHARRRLLDDRNERMVERMTALLEKGNAFVAVGAAHLPGEMGLLALLAKQGWTVTRAW